MSYGDGSDGCNCGVQKFRQSSGRNIRSPESAKPLESPRREEPQQFQRAYENGSRSHEGSAY